MGIRTGRDTSEKLIGTQVKPCTEICVPLLCQDPRRGRWDHTHRCPRITRKFPLENG